MRNSVSFMIFTLNVMCCFQEVPQFVNAMLYFCPAVLFKDRGERERLE